VRGVQVKMFGNDHDQKGIFFFADYLPVQGWEPGGIQAGRKRDTSGTQAGYKRNGSGIEAERQWDASETEAGWKRNGTGIEAG
jgi:hypothetical protein